MKKRPDYIDPQPRPPAFWWSWGFVCGVLFTVLLVSQVMT